MLRIGGFFLKRGEIPNTRCLRIYITPFLVVGCLEGRFWISIPYSCVVLIESGGELPFRSALHNNWKSLCIEHFHWLKSTRWDQLCPRFSFLSCARSLLGVGNSQSVWFEQTGECSCDVRDANFFFSCFEIGLWNTLKRSHSFHTTPVFSIYGSYTSSTL